MRLALACAVALPLASFTAASAEETVLRGLGQGVCLSTVSPRADDPSTAPTSQALAEAVRDELGRQGVRVSDIAKSCLHVEVHYHTLQGAGLVSYAVGTSLREEVQITRDPRALVQAPVWSRISVGTTLSAKLTLAVLATVRGAVEDFATDYLIVNPAPVAPP